MKKTCILIALALSAGVNAFADESPATNDAPFATQSPAPGPQGSRFGAGLVIGEPTGPNVKYWINDTLALDGTVGWSLRDGDNVYVNADALWHKFDVIPVSSGRTAAYIGVGPSIEFRHEEDNRFGVRAPVGISYMLDNKPIDVFVEVAPVLDVSPGLHGDFTAGIGVRFWF